MIVLLLNGSDRGGGAEVIASELQRRYQEAGHEAWMAVAIKQSANKQVVAVDRDAHRNAWARFCVTCTRPVEQARGRFPPAMVRRGVRSLRELVGEPARWLQHMRGREDFDFPWTAHLLDQVPGTVDLLHAHNLHGRYFDLRSLAHLSLRLPFVVTMHDAWLLSGHCSHSFDCERWKIGCGHCPDLTIYPPIPRDATAYNWQRKKAIYAASRLYVATPSRWLMDKVEQSILKPGIKEVRVIPNGIDLAVFHPQPQRVARLELGLPFDARIILFVANKIQRNPFKDWPTLRAALLRVGQSSPSGRVCLLAVGEAGPSEEIPGAEIRFVPFQTDAARMAAYYQAADLYVHAARADTFPNTILEALACGLPVVATRVGGIPEQVQDGKTGCLVPAGDAQAMAQRILQLIGDPPLRQSMGMRAAQVARERFSLERMTSDYLSWFEHILHP